MYSRTSTFTASREWISWKVPPQLSIVDPLPERKLGVQRPQLPQRRRGQNPGLRLQIPTNFSKNYFADNFYSDEHMFLASVKTVCQFNEVTRTFGRSASLADRYNTSIRQLCDVFMTLLLTVNRLVRKYPE